MRRTASEYIKFVLTILIVLACAGFCALRLMKIQVVESQNYQRQTSAQTSYTQSIAPTRGEILDADGNVLVGNHVSYAVMIDKALFPADDQQANQILLELVQILSDAKLEWADTLPVSMNSPYRFRMDVKQEDLNTMKDIIGVNHYATAENCMQILFETYQIDENYTPRQKRMIAGLRYAMAQADFSVSNQFEVAKELPMSIVTELSQLSMRLQGIVINQIPERKIKVGNVIPHEIGTTGPIYAENAEEYLSKGYSLDAIVGISGIEKAMEEELQGSAGVRTITFQAGEVISDEITTPVTAGHTIKLTVNSDFQKGLQKILNNFLDNFQTSYMQKDDDGKVIKSGALVVLDAKTGAVLGEATAPTYNLAKYSKNYEELSTASGDPLFNRATLGLYRPGSTFKTITATAGLNEGLVTGKTTFFCGREYQYHDVTFSCTGYHGNINVSKALMVSCNSYFYELSRMLNIDKIVEYANYYGIGQNTGIETRDSAGYMASPEKYEELGVDWTVGQVLQAGIGNGETMVTPLQLACVACTIANEGVRYEPYLVDSIWDYSQKKCLKKTKPAVASRIPLYEDNVYENIEKGMILASTNNFPSKYSLQDFDYDVAIKTGTPQSDSHYQDSVFIGYAPADDPEIAFAGVVEGGENSKYMIRSILELYESVYHEEEIETESEKEKESKKETETKKSAIWSILTAPSEAETESETKKSAIWSLLTAPSEAETESETKKSAIWSLLTPPSETETDSETETESQEEYEPDYDDEDDEDDEDDYDDEED